MPEKSLIGLKNLVAWELLADPDGGTPEYGPAIALGGAIDATLSPDTSEASEQYADDVVFDSLSPDTPYTMEIDIAGMSIANQAKLQGHAVSTTGGLIVKQGDNPPYFAFAFKSEKSGGGYRYVVIYKAKPQFMPRTFHTKEGTSVTRQTSKMTLKAIGRTADGLKQYITDTDTAGFFTAPHAPVESAEISITTQPLDQAITASVGGSLTIEAAVDAGVPDTYQWYKAVSKDYAGAVVSTYTGNNTATLTIPAITAGTHYFFCKLSNAGSRDVYSDIAVIIAE